MKELKCPNCGKVFTVDESDYVTIVNQVKNAEFNAEIERRLKEIEDRKKAEFDLAASEAEKEFASKINAEEQKLNEKIAEIQRMKVEMQAMEARINSEKDREIERLKAQLEGYNNQKETEVKLAVMEVKSELEKNVQERDTQISQLKSDIELEKTRAKLECDTLKDRHQQELKDKQELIDYYKDFKAKLSTKMIGESLEVHCSTQFNTLLRPIMPNAYFEKDNDIKERTKGDFVFKDSVDGIEYVSIMFEMKNEADETTCKHKNEDFLKKLDDDRKKKGCEYAVLVSTLEPESELYNNGIVDMSHKFEKMYVIRPQFFIPLITLLVQTSKNSLEYKRQLIIAQNKEVDVTNFENKLDEFKNKFGYHYELATKKFDNAIKEIDKTIDNLQKIKDFLLGSEKNLALANKDTEELTIRKLTYKNPTMKQKFDEARESQEG